MTTIDPQIPVDPTAEIMTIDEVASMLQVSIRTLYRDPPPSILVGRRTRRFLRSAVLRWLQERGRQS